MLHGCVLQEQPGPSALPPGARDMLAEAWHHQQMVTAAAAGQGNISGVHPRELASITETMQVQLQQLARAVAELKEVRQGWRCCYPGSCWLASFLPSVSWTSCSWQSTSVDRWCRGVISATCMQAVDCPLCVHKTGTQAHPLAVSCLPQGRAQGHTSGRGLTCLPSVLLCLPDVQERATLRQSLNLQSSVLQAAAAAAAASAASRPGSPVLLGLRQGSPDHPGAYPAAAGAAAAAAGLSPEEQQLFDSLPGVRHAGLAAAGGAGLFQGAVVDGEVMGAGGYGALPLDRALMQQLHEAGERKSGGVGRQQSVLAAAVRGRGGLLLHKLHAASCGKLWWHCILPYCH